jgi:hypothetical protein
VEWFRQVQFIAAVAMPEAEADRYGTTVNGMWADPEALSPRQVEQAHAKGRRVLFSVPMIALTPRVYEARSTAALLHEVCLDIEGNPAHVSWYYWEDKPVFSACIFSDTFRGYLFDRCRGGVDRDMDVVNLDEINTSIGLISREPAGSGFCHYCLDRFRRRIPGTPDAHLAGLDDRALRRLLKADDELYARYRSGLEHEAVTVMLEFIKDVRSYARRARADFAVTANVAYLGNLVPAHGDLWCPMWGDHIDFVMMENAYQLAPELGGEHLLLPRGTFAPWYRLASAFASRAPAWICPSITVPKQLAGEDRTQYYLLMFLEAYANGGRWGYNWWPGVDAATRRQATAPAQIADWTRFITDHRELYEEAVPRNEIAVLYLDSSIGRSPQRHFAYVALAQALSEAGYQFDVVYSGNGVYSSDALDMDRLAAYSRVLVPHAEGCTPPQRDVLVKYARRPGCELVVFATADLDGLGRQADGQVLSDFWSAYRGRDRDAIIAQVHGAEDSRIRSSDPAVVATRYARGNMLLLHLLNYNYDVETDTIRTVRDLQLTVPWPAGRPVTASLLTPAGERRVDCAMGPRAAVLHVGDFDLYGLLVLQ